LTALISTANRKSHASPDIMSIGCLVNIGVVGIVVGCYTSLDPVAKLVSRFFRSGLEPRWCNVQDDAARVSRGDRGEGKTWSRLSSGMMVFEGGQTCGR
jgi:hypothetical protein